MTDSANVCVSCGAHLNQNDDDCPLCGFSLGEKLTIDNALPSAIEVFKDLPATPGESEAIPAVLDAKADAPVGRTGSIGPIVLLAGILLVAGLYLLSSLSSSKEVVETPIAAGSTFQPDLTQVEPLAAEVVERVATIQAEADALSGTQRLDKLRELAVLYQNELRFDLAGDTQNDIAQQSGMEIDWVRSGNLYYDWMETQAGTAKSYYAQKAIAAYLAALELNPDNLDVRTDMAVAYLFDSQNPMQAILNTNMVLEQDSLHLQANFNRGIMLMQINRMEDAVKQFRKVIRLAPDHNNPVNQRAREAIRILESSSNGDE